MDALGILLGLLGAFIGLALPFTGWAIPPRIARWITIISLILTVACLALVIWKVLTEFQVTLAAIQAMLELPSVRAFFIHASLLVGTLIAVMLLLVRPLFRNMQEMKRALVRYVLPRHLSEEQSAIIAQILSQHPPSKVVIQQSSNFEEVSAFAADFQRTFIEGGWEVSFETADRVIEGLTMHLEQPIRSPDSFISDEEKAYKVLQEALKQAKVAMNNQSNGSGFGTTEPKLTLCIGPRRMDDNDIRARRQQVERLKEFLKSDEGELD